MQTQKKGRKNAKQKNTQTTADKEVRWVTVDIRTNELASQFKKYRDDVGAILDHLVLFGDDGNELNIKRDPKSNSVVCYLFERRDTDREVRGAISGHGVDAFVALASALFKLYAVRDGIFLADDDDTEFDFG